jgi:hypothetical protein
MYCAYAVAARLCTLAGVAISSWGVVGAARQLGRSAKAINRIRMGIQSALGDKSKSGDIFVSVDIILGIWIQLMAGPIVKCVAREAVLYILRLDDIDTYLCLSFQM